jgi:hypothetical protein
VFKGEVTDHGLHTLAVVLVVAGALALAMTLLDRRLRAPAVPAGPPRQERPTRAGSP